ncbi:MAG: hypothetical protein IT532_04055 [Burkholderiales bacterium]|nr:hypothetical protein [Burkholderiales bacterium]
MDETTQQNAALVEEAAAAAESMEEQARGLVDAVAVFKVSGSDAVQVERRGPNRAKNVERLPQAKAQVKPGLRQPAPAPRKMAAGGGADDEWQEF